MKLDLREIASNVGKSYNYEIREECAESEDLRCTKPIVGSINFTNTGNLIVARGKLETEIELECSRCLEKLTIPVNVKIDEQLPIPVFQTAFVEQEDVDEEEEEPLFRDNVFDLSEYIRQVVLVEVPIQPLCSDTCKGLCPTCGTNLNQGLCNCPVDVEASPFAALASMLEEEDTEEKE
ncbi:MAG TPA: DUF177 domain-containing protein [Armatimonadota bacterium]|nr:DUF177 domain-containing protein [Armatimonadota bacterium]